MPLRLDVDNRQYVVKDREELDSIISERLVDARKNNKYYADLNDLNVSNIDNFSYLFSISKIRDIDKFNFGVEEWDVSNAKDMRYMFSGCTNFNCDVSGWDMSNCENMEFMFYGCLNFSCDLTDWNISHCKKFICAFGNTKFPNELKPKAFHKFFK